MQSDLPSNYPTFLGDIKQQIQQAQLKALAAVNTELIVLYWHIGKQILEQQEKQGWGAGVINQLSSDLHAAFPEMRGFSSRNLGYMKSFAQAYPDEAILQAPLAKITWYHHITLLDKVKDEEERLWYIQQSAEHGWSRNILVHQIETDLYNRSGKALTNFKATLPALDSDLAQDTLKDPYVFDFITTSDEMRERHLQSGLIGQIERFLLELGVGFTFVGSNYHLVVGDKDYYLDLLFYHVRLRRYVVVELKLGEFKPEHAGKVGFYITAVDKQVKQPEDNPTIGIILVKSKDKVTAEYALEQTTSPVGVASYTYTTDVPEELQGKLPNVTDLEKSLQQMQEVDEQSAA